MLNTKEPEFIGIGGHRCGTTWLFSNLLKINDLKCLNKETHFFSRHYDFGYDWYFKQIFNSETSSEKFCEFSTSYLYCQNAPLRIKTNFPSTKILVVLRNPINRTLSHLRHEVYNGRSKYLNIKKAFNNNPSLIELSLYFSHISRWKSFFSENQLKIILFEEMIRDPVSVLNSIQSFLGLKKISENDFINEKINQSLYPNSSKKYNAYHSLRKIYSKIPLLKKLLPNKIKDNLKKKITSNFLEEKTSINDYKLIKDLFLKNDLLNELDKLSNLIDKDLKKIWKI